MTRLRGIRQTVVEPAHDLQEAAPAGALGTPGPLQPLASAARPCRPLRRLPVPILSIMDDGQRKGETVRMRKSPLRIGRTVGEVRIPHDDAIADPQAEIAWLKQTLLVRDVAAQPGLFHRVAKARLNVGQVIRIGRAGYQFGEPGLLMPLDVVEGRRWIPLPGNEVWIGRDPGPGGIACADPAVDRRHVRLIREASDRWSLVDNDSLNGTWIGVAEIQVDGVVEFMLGEQVFRLEVPR